MFETIARLLLYSVAVLITAYILPGVDIGSFWIAIVVAAVLSLLNGFLKPVLIILTIPVTVFTLGLFLLVINALIVLLAAGIVPGFAVNGFWWALLFSIILSFFTILFGANSSQSDAF
jgi:putative membrane protein